MRISKSHLSVLLTTLFLSFAGCGETAKLAQKKENSVKGDFEKSHQRSNPKMNRIEGDDALLIEKILEAIQPLDFRTGRVEVPLFSKSEALRSEEFYKTGVDHYLNDRIVDSLRSLTKAIRHDSSRAAYFEQLGIVFRSTHSFFTPYAEAALQSALDLDPNLFQARYELAALLHHNRRLPEAIKHFEQIVKLNPEHVGSHYYLAAAYSYLSERKLAKKHYEIALKLGAKFPKHFVASLLGVQKGEGNNPMPLLFAGRLEPEYHPANAVRASSGDTGFRSVEPDISCNSSGSEVVVVWQDYRRATRRDPKTGQPDPCWGPHDTGYAVSFDHGTTWAPSVSDPYNPFLPPNCKDFNLAHPDNTIRRVVSDGMGDPVTVFDPVANNFYIMGLRGGLHAVRRTSVELADENPETVARIVPGNDRAKIKVFAGGPGNTQFYVDGNGQGVFRTTGDPLEDLTPPFDWRPIWNPDTGVQNNNVFFDCAVACDGKPYALGWDVTGNFFDMKQIRFYHEFNENDVDPRFEGIPAVIETRMTPNGGGHPAGFANNFATGPARLATDPTDPSRLYAAFTDQVDGDVDVFVYVSDDYGQPGTWKNTGVVGDGAGRQFFPEIEIDPYGRVHLAFFSIPSESDEADVQYAWSDNAAATWTVGTISNEPIDPENSGPAAPFDDEEGNFSGDYIGLTHGGNFVYVAYPSTPVQDGDGANIYVNRILNPPPISHLIERGVLVSGDVSQLFNSDDDYLRVNPGFTLNNTEPPVWINFTLGAPYSATTPLMFSIESNANTPNLSRTIEIKNVSTGSFDLFDEDPPSFNVDETTVVDLDMNGNFMDYVDGNGEVNVRVGWKSSGFTIVFPWEVRIDKIGLTKSD